MEKRLNVHLKNGFNFFIFMIARKQICLTHKIIDMYSNMYGELLGNIFLSFIFF